MPEGSDVFWEGLLHDYKILYFQKLLWKIFFHKDTRFLQCTALPQLIYSYYLVLLMFFGGFLAKVPPYLRVHCVLEENTVNKVPPDARPGEQEIIPAEKEARFVPPLAAAEVMVVWWYGQAAPSQPLCVLQLVGPALHQRHLLPHEVQPVRQQQVIHPNPSSPLYALNGIVFTDFQTFFAAHTKFC